MKSTYIDLMVKRNNKQEKKMSKENFEKQIRKRMEQLDEINKHGIFKELKGTVTDFNYDTKSLTMTFEATKFHENAFGIMFGGSLAGMFDIAFGTLTAGLGDYSVAPTVQLSTTFLKGIPTGATVRTEVEAVSTGKTIMNFVGKAYVGEELVGSASGTFMTPRPFKKFNTERKRILIVTPISFLYHRKFQGNPLDKVIL